MSSLSSKLKNWLRRNGFVGEGMKGRKKPMRQCNGYVERNGRKYRFREKSGVVDIGEKFETFDRWANSIEDTIPIEQFISEFKATQ